jgi:hypothetical protein
MLQTMQYSQSQLIKWVSIENIISKTDIITNHFIIAEFIHY